MFRSAIVSLAVALAAIPTPANADQFDTGNSVLALCTADEPDEIAAVKRISCISFISGAVKALQLSAERNDEKDFCLNSSVNGQVIVANFVSYLRRFPDLGDFSPIFALLGSLSETFPCSDDQPDG